MIEPTRAEWIGSALRRYEQPLIRYAAGITGNMEQARDVVQDTFLRLCAADAARLDGRLAPWLYTVCRNRALDVRKKEGGMKTLDLGGAAAVRSAGPAPSTVAERHEAAGMVQEVLAGLRVARRGVGEAGRRGHDGFACRNSDISEVRVEVATYILFILGCLGATDILLYHSVSHGIRTHVDSRSELVIHSLRGPTYAALFILMPNYAMHGVFFWLLIGIFVVDVSISVADFMIEGVSRKFFGGLPSGEYVLHIVMAMLFGAMVASVFYGAGD